MKKNKNIEQITSTLGMNIESFKDNSVYSYRNATHTWTLNDVVLYRKDYVYYIFI